MSIRFGPSRRKRNNPLVLGIVFIGLGIFMAIQLKSIKTLAISLIGVLAIIFWVKTRKKHGPVTALERIADVVGSIKKV